MKVALVGKNLDDIRPVLKEYNIVIDEKNPDIIITHGGDGALFGAERIFPGIPKFPIRDERTAPLCEEHHCRQQIKKLVDNEIKNTDLMKIAGFTQNHFISGINDVFIHSVNRVSAMRYRVYIDEEIYADDIVGDGVGVSTVHGSTAYYRSITHSAFRIGIGLAFSNSTEVTTHIVLPESSKIKIELTRGPAEMFADNNPHSIKLAEGESAVIKRIDQKSHVLGLDVFMCPKCRKLRNMRNFLKK